MASVIPPHKKVENVAKTLTFTQSSSKQPTYSTIHYINYKKEYEEILNEKIFIIDDGSHSTMLFAKEY